LDIVLVSSSPGEVHGLARPVAEKALAMLPAADVWIFVSPGGYASGREARVASAYPGVRKAVNPREFLSFLAFGKRPLGFASSGSGVVVHLGGKLGFSVLLSRRLKYPLIVYTDRTIQGAKSVSAFLVEDERIQASLISKGVPADRVRLVGNLMIDGIGVDADRDEARTYLGAKDEERVVLLFPGTRTQEVAVMAPFLFRAVELLARVERDLRFVLCLSPFIGTASLDSIFSHSRHRGKIDGSSATVLKSAGPLEAVTAEGVNVRIETLHRYEAMVAADIAICTPGPVCSELAYLGTPYVAAAPLNVPSAVPLPGVSPFLSAIPLLGEILRKRAIERREESGRFLSIPNIKAGKLVAPEVVGQLRPEDVVIPCVELLGDTARRDRISRELREAMGVAGAAEMVVQTALSASRGTLRGTDRGQEQDSS
jgi:hypothetical protein